MVIAGMRQTHRAAAFQRDRGGSGGGGSVSSGESRVSIVPGYRVDNGLQNRKRRFRCGLRLKLAGIDSNVS